MARKIAKQFFPDLRSDQVVHHIDGNPRNNDPNNLMIMDQGEHLEFHAKFRKKNKTRKTFGRVGITLYQDQIDGLREVSKTDERPLSVHMRRAVDDYLAKMRAEKDRYLERE